MNRALLAATLCALLLACSTAPSQTSASREKLPQPTGWKAVLVAGDDQEPAFDNAVDAMAGRLAELGVPGSSIAILKASKRGAQAATGANVATALAALNPGATDGCFLFITSHGGPDSGLVMKRERSYLDPGELDRLLSRPCAKRPTVVITSGCFSGIYAQDRRVVASNRTILTAARRDRPSFGCNAERRFTVFDACVLDSLQGGLTWQAVMRKTRSCVSAQEQALGVEAPSSPQMSVGAAVSDLVVFTR